MPGQDGKLIRYKYVMRVSEILQDEEWIKKYDQLAWDHAKKKSEETDEDMEICAKIEKDCSSAT